MSKGIRNTVILCLAFVALVLGALIYNVSHDPLLSEEGLRQEGAILLPRPRELSAFELQDQNGDPFTLDNMKNGWNFIYFGYTYCPDVCPVTLSMLAKMERQMVAAGEQELLDHLNVILVTVDPERDDSTTLKNYVGAFSERFIGLTGSLEAIAGLAQQLNVAFGKVPGQGDSYLVDHTGNIILVNSRGHYDGFIRPPHDPEKLRLIYKTLAAGDK